MTRCRTWTAIVALLIVATALPLVAMPQNAAASALRARLSHARHRLADARHHLADARADLTAALAITSETPTTSATPTPEPTATDAAGTAVVPTEIPGPDPAPTATAAPAPTATPEAAATLAATSGPTIEQLKARVVKWRTIVRRVQRRVKRLARAYRLKQQLVTWERNRQWRPIIRVAAAKYGVSGDRMYRIMMRESGGNRYAGTMYKGLFQYYPGTWTASWNPWRHDSIWDGSSQIFATAYAIHRGYGSSMWPNTY